MNHLDTIKSIHSFIKNEDDDVIVRGWEKKDFDKQYPNNQGEGKEASKFLYVRDGFLSRIWQKITAWTGDAKRKQGLAKKYINDQLEGLKNSSQNSEIKNYITDLRKKIDGVSGDLKVIHIKEGLETLVTFLKTEEKTEINVEPIEKESANPKVDKYGNPKILYNPNDLVDVSLTDRNPNTGNTVNNIDNGSESESESDFYIGSDSDSDNESDNEGNGCSIVSQFEDRYPSSNLSTTSQSPHISTTASDKKNPSNNNRIDKKAPVFPQVIASKNFEATESDRNSSLLPFPKEQITVGSKRSAGEFDADYYVFPKGEDKKIPSQIVKEKIIEITTPQLTTPQLNRENSPYGLTMQHLNTYENNLLAAYRETFAQIGRQIASNSKDSFSLSIEMPVPPQSAVNKANQATAQALHEFLLKYPKVSVYIQTSGSAASEGLRMAIYSNRNPNRTAT